MARPRPEKRPPPDLRLLPMQLELGDRIVDETGEYEVAGRPYVSVGGKTTNVRVRRVGDPGATMIRLWGSHERITVRRATPSP